MADMQNPNGKMRIIIATSTISMGVNIKGYNSNYLIGLFLGGQYMGGIIMGGDIIMGAEKGIETSSNKQQILINN